MPLPIDLAVIGGTGLYRLAALDDVQSFEADTVYGAASAPVRIGMLGGRRVAFLARHGEEHSVPPHLVNYRANLWVLREQGARKIISVATVGGIRGSRGCRRR